MRVAAMHYAVSALIYGRVHSSMPLSSPMPLPSSIPLPSPMPLPSPCSVDPVTGGPGKRKRPSESMTPDEQEIEARKLEDAIAQLNRWEESVTMATVGYCAVCTYEYRFGLVLVQ